MALAASRARRIITVSQASKDDIQHYLKTPAEKIEVIHNGLDSRFLDPPDDANVARVRDRFMLDSPFILYAGNIKPHKNVDRLIEAFALMRKNGHDGVKLLIIGDDLSKYPGLRRLVHRHHLRQHVRFLGFVPDSTLSALYRLAKVFVFPTLYEGFGFPPLEAIACGTPTIVSDRGALREISGDAAIFIDPDSPESIAAAVEALLMNDAQRAESIARGLDHVKQFTWRSTAEKTLALYQEVLNA
jgi:glycosyltransferase involved in cell wall biosynthesis